MIRVFVRHPVANFEKWWDGYRAKQHLRDQGGVRGHGVYQAVGDPNDVIVWHDFDSREAAESFAASPDLKAAMAELGVSGTPSIWFTQATV